jgi:hypothetical protein
MPMSKGTKVVMEKKLHESFDTGKKPGDFYF